MEAFCLKETNTIPITKEWHEESNSLWLGIAEEFICPRILKMHHKKQGLEYPYGYLVINIDEMEYYILCAASCCYFKYLSGEKENKSSKSGCGISRRISKTGTIVRKIVKKLKGNVCSCDIVVCKLYQGSVDGRNHDSIFWELAWKAPESTRSPLL